MRLNSASLFCLIKYKWRNKARRCAPVIRSVWPVDQGHVTLVEGRRRWSGGDQEVKGGGDGSEETRRWREEEIGTSVRSPSSPHFLSCNRLFSKPSVLLFYCRAPPLVVCSVFCLHAYYVCVHVRTPRVMHPYWYVYNQVKVKVSVWDREPDVWVCVGGGEQLKINNPPFPPVLRPFLVRATLSLLQDEAFVCSSTRWCHT